MEYNSYIDKIMRDNLLDMLCLIYENWISFRFSFNVWKHFSNLIAVEREKYFRKTEWLMIAHSYMMRNQVKSTFLIDFCLYSKKNSTENPTDIFPKWKCVSVQIVDVHRIISSIFVYSTESSLWTSV